MTVPLIPGTLGILILRALRSGPLHGYAVARWIHEHSREVLSVEEGVLYPALHRLERDGLVSSVWAITETGRRAKFYELSDKGQAWLRAESARWRRTSAAVTAALESGG